MSIFDRFENAVGRGANSALSRVLRSGIKPVNVNSAIRRSMDGPAKESSPERTIVTNHFVVYAAYSDFAPLEVDLETLAGEFALQATEHATANEYTFLNPVHIGFVVDDTERTGQLRVGFSNRRDPAAPTTAPLPSPTRPIIGVDDGKWLLTKPIMVTGRGTEADTVVNDSGVSCCHLELHTTPADVIAIDLGSTNGTFVEGHRIDATTLLDGNRIVIGQTPIDFWTCPDSDGGQWLQISHSPFSDSLF